MTGTAEDLKKKNAEEKAAREKMQAEQRQRATGKPTPTQEELDAANSGETATEHEADGSAVEGEVAKQLEANKPAAGYETRAMPAAPAGRTHQPAGRSHPTASE